MRLRPVPSCLADPTRLATQSRGLLRLLAVAAGAGLLFGGHPLAAWTRNLPDNPLSAAVRDGAELWSGLGDRVGLNAPYDGLRGLRQRLEDMRFVGSAD